MRAKRGVATLVIASSAVLAACEMPSELPIFQQTWVIPTDSVTVSVAELLPNGITLTEGGTPSFTVTTPSGSISTDLGAICNHPVCQNNTPTAIPSTPAFSSPAGLLSSSISFPSDVSNLTISGGSLRLAITNQLGFDPLRPNGASTAPYGRIIVRISSGASVTRTDTIVGSPAQGIPNGASTTLSVPLPTGIYNDDVQVSVALDVPAGDGATLSAGNSLSIVASLFNANVSQATVAVSGQPVDTDPTEFDLEDVDFADQVAGGGLRFVISNPFTATASVDVVITAPDGESGTLVIRKPIHVPDQLSSTASVTLTRSEILSLIGRSDITIRVSGAVNGTGPGNTVSVTPSSQLAIQTQLELILNVGAN